MWDFEVGQFLHVFLKEPRDRVLKGKYQGSNEKECVLYVDERTDMERTLFIPNSNIAHIAKVSSRPVAPGFGVFLRSELVGLVGMEELRSKAS